MRTQWFLLLVWATVALLVLGGCTSFLEHLATPEGREAAKQFIGGAGAAVVNPVNPMAWWDIALGGGALLAGWLGLKGAGAGAQAVGRAVKRHVLNPAEVLASIEAPAEPEGIKGFGGV